jgi:hypothetical protein
MPALELTPHDGLEPPDDAFDVLDAYSASRHHALSSPLRYIRALSPSPALYCARYTYRAVAPSSSSTTPCSSSRSRDTLTLPLHRHLHHPRDLVDEHRMSTILGLRVRALLGHHTPRARRCAPGYPPSPPSPSSRCSAMLEQTAHPSSASCTGCCLLHTRRPRESASPCSQWTLALLVHAAPGTTPCHSRSRTSRTPRSVCPRSSAFVRVRPRSLTARHGPRILEARRAPGADTPTCAAAISTGTSSVSTSPLAM